MARYHVWYESGYGWFYDDAEDHGGYDRISACGPFNRKDTACEDARKVFGRDAEALPGRPLHYDTDT